LVTTFCFTAFIDKKFLARKYFITNSTENEHRLEKELLENAASPAKLTIKIVMSRLRLQQKNGGTQLATAIYVQNSGIISAFFLLWGISFWIFPEIWSGNK
jgi:hypothetical protein